MPPSMKSKTKRKPHFLYTSVERSESIVSRLVHAFLIITWFLFLTTNYVIKKKLEPISRDGK